MHLASIVFSLDKKVNHEAIMNSPQEIFELTPIHCIRYCERKKNYRKRSKVEPEARLDPLYQQVEQAADFV